MFDRFIMNGVRWAIYMVDPSSSVLIDRTGTHTLACTDPVTKRIYISNNLDRELYFKVLLHELSHCVIISYNLTDYIKELVKPLKIIEAEEFMCNLIAEYGVEVIENADSVMINYKGPHFN